MPPKAEEIRIINQDARRLLEKLKVMSEAAPELRASSQRCVDLLEKCLPARTNSELEKLNAALAYIEGEEFPEV